LTKSEGGRHKPFFNGYRPQFYIRTTDVTGTVNLPEGTEMVITNMAVPVKITYMKEDAPPTTEDKVLKMQLIKNVYTRAYPKIDKLEVVTMADSGLTFKLSSISERIVFWISLGQKFFGKCSISDRI